MLKANVLCILLGLILSSPAFAVLETELPRRVIEEIIPFIKEHFPNQYSSERGIQLCYIAKKVKNEKAALVILPGMTQSHFHFSELLYDLRDKDYSIYVLNHRGQGCSGPLLKKASQKEITHVESFQDYMGDLDWFVKTVVKPTSSTHLILLGHSMGGAIATLYAAQNPRIFRRLILSAPMFQINFSRAYRGVNWKDKCIETGLYYAFVGITYVGSSCGIKNRFFPTQTGYNWDEKFDGNELTHSSYRFGLRNLVTEHTGFGYGGGSYQWLLEAIRATHAIRNIKSFDTETLILKPEQDSLVNVNSFDAFFLKNNLYRTGKSKIVSFKNAFHELLAEVDCVRDRVIEEIISFVEG